MVGTEGTAGLSYMMGIFKVISTTTSHDYHSLFLKAVYSKDDSYNKNINYKV